MNVLSYVELNLHESIFFLLFISNLSFDLQILFDLAISLILILT